MFFFALWIPRGVPVESSRNPPVDAQVLGTDLGVFAHRQLSTSSTGSSTHSRAAVPTCDGAGSGLWIPRGIRVDSSRNPPGCHHPAPACEQQGESGGTTRGLLEDENGTTSRVHRRRRFILETPHGHPHAAVRSDLRIRSKSTDSTVPTTTSVLFLEEISSKQGVWKVGRTGSARSVLHSQAARRRGTGRERGIGREGRCGLPVLPGYRLVVGLLCETQCAADAAPQLR